MDAELQILIVGDPHEQRGESGPLVFAQRPEKGLLMLARDAQAALVDASIGIVWAPKGKLQRVLRVSIADGKIVSAEVIADPERLGGLDLAVIDD